MKKIEIPYKYQIYQDENSPQGWGVLAVVFSNPSVGWSILTGGEFYIFIADGVLPVDRDGLLDYVVNALDKVYKIVVGRMVTAAEFNEVYKLAKKDWDFATKAGFLPSEKQAVEVS